MNSDTAPRAADRPDPRRDRQRAGDAGGDIAVTAGYGLRRARRRPASAWARSRSTSRATRARGQDAVHVGDRQRHRRCGGREQLALGGSISINVIAHDITRASRVPARSWRTAASSSRPPTTSATSVGGSAASARTPRRRRRAADRQEQGRAYIGDGTRRRRRGATATASSPLTARRLERRTSQTTDRQWPRGHGDRVRRSSTRSRSVSRAAARFGVAGSGGVTVMDRHVHAYIGETRASTRARAGESTDQSVLVLASTARTSRCRRVGRARRHRRHRRRRRGRRAHEGHPGVDRRRRTRLGAARHQACWPSRRRPSSRSPRPAAGGLTVGIAGAVDVYVMTSRRRRSSRPRRPSRDGLSGPTTSRPRAASRSRQSPKTEVDFIAGNIASAARRGHRRRASSSRSITKNTYASSARRDRRRPRPKKGRHRDVRDGTFAAVTASALRDR